MLDRLMKDIVTEHPNVNIENFIPLLRERIFVENPHTRMVGEGGGTQAAPFAPLLHSGVSSRCQSGFGSLQPRPCPRLERHPASFSFRP